MSHINSNIWPCTGFFFFKLDSDMPTHIGSRDDAKGSSLERSKILVD